MCRYALAFCLVVLPHFVFAQEAISSADAALRSVHMVDAKEGWAIGDDGLILHTLDGWESWEKQKSGVRSSLRSVHFVDAYVGYIVGMEALPYGRGTAGVVLGTNDGGVTWKKLIHRELPGLHGVKFVDAQNGYAFGDTNGGNPGGIFQTENGGRTWKACSALEVTQGWCAGTLMHDQPLAVGVAGSIGILEKEQVLPLPVHGNTQACLMSVAARNNDVWAVGTHATVAISRQTGGKSWEPVQLPFSDVMLGALDFHSVNCVGDHVWIVGRPGSVVLHSPDQGKTWEMLKTGQPLPLHCVYFVNETQGYAAGELGTILKTKDAGKSWQMMRRGGVRSAALFVSAQAQQIPLGTMALVGGDQGYLSVGLQASCMPGQWKGASDRLNHAVRTVGGMASDVLTRMPVADYQERMNAGKLLELCDQQRLLEQMVLALRMWRPSVVVCDSPDATSTAGPLGAVIAMTLRKACDLSARSDVYPEHITRLDLQPWQPSKLFHQRVPATAADCTVDLNVPRPVLFASANDFANLGRPVLNDRYVRGPVCEVYTLWKKWNEETGPKVGTVAALQTIPFMGIMLPFSSEVAFDLFAGISLGHGGQARREAMGTDDFKYQLLLAATEKQRLEAVPFQKKMFDPGEKKQFFVNFWASIKGLAPMTIGDRIAAQAQDFVDQGQWTMARECHLMLLDLLPTHRLAPESCRFVATMMGSSELRRRSDLGQMKHITDYVLTSPANKFGESNDGRVERQIQTQRTILQSRRLELRRWNGGAIAAGEVYSVLHPLGYGDPDLQFCLLASMRQDERTEQSELWQTAFQWKYPRGVWHDAAGAEHWLTQPIGLPAKPNMQAVRIAQRPKLDGKLDSDVWKKVPIHTLQKAAGNCQEQTTVQFAFDDNYLYVGVKCQQPVSMPVMEPLKPRKRDDDLRSYDRVSLLFDLDRDYGTCFHLEFDARGCVMEECCSDITWNPRWFVEVSPGKEGWTAEVAIPLVELTGKLQLENEVWAANVSRIIPGKGIQAVSLPASVKPLPQGMGLLIFSNGEVKTNK